MNITVTSTYTIHDSSITGIMVSLVCDIRICVRVCDVCDVSVHMTVPTVYILQLCTCTQIHLSYMYKYTILHILYHKHIHICIYVHVYIYGVV